MAEVLESREFRLSKTEHMKCRFKRTNTRTSFEVKIGGHSYHKLRGLATLVLPHKVIEKYALDILMC